MTAYTYILRCSDGSLYTGWTNNLTMRLAAHNSGAGSKYTRARLPVTIAYYEIFATKSEAMKREYEIKQLTHAAKMTLLANSNDKNDKK
ncbi:GIY-YIG nuclease family protein [Pectinatus frisingensis]|uniref:GIY-YIG nuclease family protein n=1 Tax=Pectinatus frisingensis TaxID=865 RepID=UPI0018C4837B|nr:GIY-YIG nuclease family protein [Pectinatus frisingensis]